VYRLPPPKGRWFCSSKSRKPKIKKGGQDDARKPPSAARIHRASRTMATPASLDKQHHARQASKNTCETAPTKKKEGNSLSLFIHANSRPSATSAPTFTKGIIELTRAEGKTLEEETCTRKHAVAGRRILKGTDMRRAGSVRKGQLSETEIVQADKKRKETKRYTPKRGPYYKTCSKKDAFRQAGGRSKQTKKGRSRSDPEVDKDKASRTK